MDVRIQKMAQVLINYSLAVKPGERVLLRASSPAAEPLVQALYQEVLKVGAHPIPYIHLRHEEILALEAAEDLNLLATVNPMLKLSFDECEVIIVIRADENQRELSGYPQATARACFCPRAVDEYFDRTRGQWFLAALHYALPDRGLRSASGHLFATI